jgi:hypothetical protein
VQRAKQRAFYFAHFGCTVIWLSISAVLAACFAISSTRFFASSVSTEPRSTIFVVTWTSSFASDESLSSAWRIAIAVAPDAGLWSALVRPVGVSCSSVVVEDGVLVAPAAGRVDGSVLLLLVDATSAVLLGAVDPVSRLAAVLRSVPVRGAVDELMRLRSLVEEDESLVVPGVVDGVLLATPLVLDVSEVLVRVPAMLVPLWPSVSGVGAVGVEEAVAVDDEGADVDDVLVGCDVDTAADVVSVLDVDGVLAILPDVDAPAVVLDVCSVAKSDRKSEVTMLSALSERTSSLLKGTRNLPLVPAKPSFASTKAIAFPDSRSITTSSRLPTSLLSERISLSSS